MWFCNITISHSPIWHFRWNVRIKTINYYTHIITLPTTLTQALLLPGPVCVDYLWRIHNPRLAPSYHPTFFWANLLRLPFVGLTPSSRPAQLTPPQPAEENVAFINKKFNPQSPPLALKIPLSEDGKMMSDSEDTAPQVLSLCHLCLLLPSRPRHLKLGKEGEWMFLPPLTVWSKRRHRNPSLHSSQPSQGGAGVSSPALLRCGANKNKRSTRAAAAASRCPGLQAGPLKRQSLLWKKREPLLCSVMHLHFSRNQEKWHRKKWIKPVYFLYTWGNISNTSNFYPKKRYIPSFTCLLLPFNFEMHSNN